MGWDDVYIVTTQDGSDTLFSHALQTTYHSVFGAVSESRHVFLQHGLATQIRLPKINILEFGFGTGLNAFLAYLFALKHEKEIHYTGIEAFQLDSGIAEKLDYPGYLAIPEERSVFLKMHSEQNFKEPYFHFSKINLFNPLEDLFKFDCIFFDAFAPVHQPELWEQAVFDQLFQLTSEQGCLVTYSAQGEVRRRMIRAGYEVARLPGPPGKREMLRGRAGLLAHGYRRGLSCCYRLESDGVN